MKPLSIPSSKYSMDTFSSVGLHVLVVDDDPVCLMVLETMLKKCNYKVTTCNRANHALDLLRDNQEDFDIVLSNAYMPDVDGFKLLEIIGLKLDLPVIIMSANGNTNAVMKGITHGACDYLIKPVRMEELRSIWQHVIRRKVTDSPSMGTHSEWNESTRADELPEHSSKKRKEPNELVQDFVDDTSSLKKARVNWSVHLHQQFVNAVNQLGVEKAVPKKLLDIMNVEGLTRENVASHLQKYRLYLKRLSGVDLVKTQVPAYASCLRWCQCVIVEGQMKMSWTYLGSQSFPQLWESKYINNNIEVEVKESEVQAHEHQLQFVLQMQSKIQSLDPGIATSLYHLAMGTIAPFVGEGMVQKEYVVAATSEGLCRQMRWFCGLSLEVDQLVAMVMLPCRHMYHLLCFATACLLGTGCWAT